MKNPSVATCQCHDCQAKRFDRRQRNLFFFVNLPAFLALLYITWRTFFS